MILIAREQQEWVGLNKKAIRTKARVLRHEVKLMLGNLWESSVIF
jgi:hypothetical protein